MPKVTYLGPADRLGKDESKPDSFVTRGEEIVLTEAQLNALIAKGHQFKGYERHFTGGAQSIPPTSERK